MELNHGKLEVIKEFTRLNLAFITSPFHRMSEEVEVDGEFISYPSSRLKTFLNARDDLFLSLICPILFPPFIILHTCIIIIFTIPFAVLIGTLCCLCACCCDNTMYNVILYILGNYIISLVFGISFTLMIAFYPFTILYTFIKYRLWLK